MIEQLLSQPGFIYEINGKYYFLGKWICKECTEVDACDCVMMYNMCRRTKQPCIFRKCVPTAILHWKFHIIRLRYALIWKLFLTLCQNLLSAGFRHNMTLS